MTQSTMITITVDPVNKTFEVDGAISERENAQVYIAGAGVPAASLEVGITERDTRFAYCADFVLEGDEAVGILNTNTTELAALFTRYIGNQRRSMSLYVWDAVNETLIAAGPIDVMNNPQSNDEPTVDVASEYYTKAEANGRFLSVEAFADYEINGDFTSRTAFDVETASITELYEVVATILTQLKG